MKEDNMGFLDGIFERKTCDICGEKCGVLGGTKLKDGRLDKNCVNKLSPLLGYLKNYTVEDIREHLAYREENEQIVKGFTLPAQTALSCTLTLKTDCSSSAAVITGELQILTF